MRIIHKPVALAWRQRASAALRARAAATLPCRAFVNNSHDSEPYKDTEENQKLSRIILFQCHSVFSSLHSVLSVSSVVSYRWIRD